MSEMEQNEFERALTRAMARVNPPETLTKFLMKAAEVEAESRLPRKERKHRWAWFVPRQSFGWMSGALAAVMLVGVFGVEQVHVRHERERAEATQQFETAMRVTDHALDQTRAQLQRAGIKLP